MLLFLPIASSMTVAATQKIHFVTMHVVTVLFMGFARPEIILLVDEDWNSKQSFSSACLFIQF